MTSPVCNVCAAALGTLVYESAEGRSITTMNVPIDGVTRVYFCEGCGHLQTTELPDLDRFYAEEYEINLASEDDDQLYAIVDGSPVYRAEHQARVLLDKVDLQPGMRVLDYGCAKAPTLRRIAARVPGLQTLMFDVTDKYVRFWETFPGTPCWAVGTPDPAWDGTVDVVLSFYALEHVRDLAVALARIRALLREGGQLHFLVPNVYANAADLIVADHINHFGEHSIRELMRRSGFHDVKVDAGAHASAYVVTARKGQGTEAGPVPADLSREHDAALALGRYWREIVGRIRDFERVLPADAVLGIYGAGFYGNFIFSSLNDMERVRCFIDQNRHLAGTAIAGRPVLAPASAPADLSHVLVGMNPVQARLNIAAIEAWQSRAFEYFFL